MAAASQPVSALSLSSISKLTSASVDIPESKASTTTPPTPVTSVPSIAVAAAKAAGTALPSLLSQPPSNKQLHHASLPTPVSAVYPSSLPSPHNLAPSHITGIKREGDSIDSNNETYANSTNTSNGANGNTCGGARTPLSPPPAYRDFLRSVSAISPSLSSPVSGTSGSFSFSASADPAARSPLSATSWRDRYHTYQKSSTTSVYTHPSHVAQPLASTTLRPALTPHANSDSSFNVYEMNAQNNGQLPVNAVTLERSRPSSAPVTVTSFALPSTPIPNTPSNGRGRQTGPLRRPSLMIPPSPSINIHPAIISSPHAMSPVVSQSPQSAASSATTSVSTSGGGSWSSMSCSPSPVEVAGLSQRSGQSTTRSFSVRHTVTRTVTFSRLVENSVVTTSSEETARASAEDGVHNRAQAKAGPVPQQQMHPLVGEAPKGKRRKVEESGTEE